MALTIAGCGLFAPSEAEGAKTAGKARPPVWGQYWDVMGALKPAIETSHDSVQGQGKFTVCPAPAGKDSQQVQYSVWTTFEAQNPQLSTPQFMTEMEQTLRVGGWAAFVPDLSDRLAALKPGPAAHSDKNGYSVYVQQDLLGDGSLVHLVVVGPCVKVGKAFTEKAPSISDDLKEEYPLADLSTRPVPTEPVPTP
jgi:hypothetical protein